MWRVLRCVAWEVLVEGGLGEGVSGVRWGEGGEWAGEKGRGVGV